MSVSGTYAYDLCLTALDYCGDIARNKKSDSPSYSANFSPNNIRRVIISMDMCIVMFHINVSEKSFGSFCANTRKLSPALVAESANREDYKPMTAILYADRICASVEEVIICTRSVDGKYSLSSKELDFASMVKSYNGSGSDVFDVVSNRYKRLYAYSIFNGSIADWLRGYCNNEFGRRMPKFHQDMISADWTLGRDFISEMDFMANAEKKYFNKDTWYKNYGSSASYYEMDAKDGKLNAHFREIIEKIESEEKSKKVHEHIKVDTTELESIIEDYNTCMKSFDIVSTLLCDAGARYEMCPVALEAGELRAAVKTAKDALQTCGYIEDEKIYGVSSDNLKKVEASSTSRVKTLTTLLKELLAKAASCYANLTNAFILKMSENDVFFRAFKRNNRTMLFNIGNSISSIDLDGVVLVSMSVKQIKCACCYYNPVLISLYCLRNTELSGKVEKYKSEKSWDAMIYGNTR